MKTIGEFIGIIAMLWLFIISLVILSGCQSTEILDGLCYNDREGTFLCPEEKLDPPKDYREHEERWNTCKPFQLDSEAWMNCMMIA